MIFAFILKLKWMHELRLGRVECSPASHRLNEDGICAVIHDQGKLQTARRCGCEAGPFWCAWPYDMIPVCCVLRVRYRVPLVVLTQAVQVCCAAGAEEFAGRNIARMCDTHLLENRSPRLSLLLSREVDARSVGSGREMWGPSQAWGGEARLAWHELGCWWTWALTVRERGLCRAQGSWGDPVHWSGQRA